MPTVLNQYLENIRHSLRLDTPAEREIVRELETHIEDRLEEMEEAGLSEEEAAETCLGLLGSTRQLARQIYEAHSQGTWKQMSLAAMPHLLFGVLFALNWWQHVGWLASVLVLVLATTVYGCRRGKPTWVFPWLGYSLLPVMIGGFSLLYLPKDWSPLTILIYFPLALWWLYYIVVQTVKRDWLLCSVTLLPIPIIIGWYLTVAPEGRLTEDSVQRLQHFAPWIGLSFLTLALTIAAFIRVRQRWLRMALLIISGLFTLTMVAYYAHGRLSLSTLIGLILVMWGVFLVPALLERWARKRVYRFKSDRGKLNYHAGGAADAQGSHYH